MKKSDPVELAKKSPKELIEYIQNLEKNLAKLKDKWGIIWNDQPQEVITEWKNKLPILEDFQTKEIKTKKNHPMNLLIEGDNYNSLSVLNYTHQNEIDMIYIDPPYNTGGTLMYNNKYVDEDDPFRHSKFLSILYHRFKIARKLLKKNGVICCTIDNQELMPVLGILEKLDAKILNIITIIIKPEGRNQDKYIMGAHEYAIFATWGKPESRRILPRAGIKQNYDETTSDGRKFRWDTFYRRGDEKAEPEKESRWYKIYVNEKTLKISATKKGKGWRAILPVDTNKKKLIWDALPSDFEEMIDNLDSEDPEIVAKINKKTNQITIHIRRWEQYFSKPLSYWNHPDYSPQAYGAKLVPKILNKNIKFDYPKSVFAVYDCLDIFLPENGLVLDFFAGSGTTGHAVQLLNMRDNDMNLAFIKKFGEQYHKNKDFLNSDAKFYSHFDPKLSNRQPLTPQEISKKWLEWRRNRSQRRFILCTNNEIPEKQLIELRKTKSWTKEKEQNSSEGICRKITYPRMKGISKGFKWNEDKARKLLFPLTSDGYILQSKKWEKDSVPGFPFKMKYLKVGFVPAKKSDGNKIILVKNSINMLCVKEDCFDIVKELKDKFMIFQNPQNKYLGIVFDDDGIEPIIKEIKKITNSSKFIVYVLTFDKNSRLEEFEEVKDIVEVATTPKDIYTVYENVKRQYYND